MNYVWKSASSGSWNNVQSSLEEVFDHHPLHFTSYSRNKTSSKSVNTSVSDPLRLLMQKEDDSDDVIMDNDNSFLIGNYGEERENEDDDDDDDAEEDDEEGEKIDDWKRIMKRNDEDDESVKTRFKDLKIPIPTSMHPLLHQIIDDGEPYRRKERTKLERLERSQDERITDKKERLRIAKELGISSTQFFSLIQLLNSQLSKYWLEDQKVQAIQLIIQAAKMLNNEYPETESFFPYKFFPLADLITQFGKISYSRLLSKSPGIKVHFSSRDVCDLVKELCRNWFYKVAVIRELIPRFYLEVSLLKCYRLLQDEEETNFEEILSRITLTLRGVADPLVNLHARSYLIRITQTLNISHELIRQIGSSNYYESVLILETKTPRNYELYQNCVRWLTEGTMFGLNSDYDRDKIISNHVRQLSDSSGLFLDVLINASTPTLLMEILEEISSKVVGCTDPNYPKYRLISSLGRCLNKGDDLTLDKSRKNWILNACWSCIVDFDKDAYYDCVIVWTEFICRNLIGLSSSSSSNKEINAVFKDVVDHYDADNDDKIVRDVLKVVFRRESSLSLSCLSLSNFLPLFQRLKTLDFSIEIAKLILETICKNESSRKIRQISDQVSINVLIHLCGVLSDSVTSLSVRDEVRQISALICSTIRLVHFDDDHQHYLQFLTEMRGKFAKLEVVQTELITLVNTLSVIQGRRNDNNNNNNNNNNNVRGFLQACSAFVFITIPSISDDLSKMKLYVHSGRVAFMNRCLGQGRSCLKSAIDLIPIIPTSIRRNDGTVISSEPGLISCINDLLSTLLVVPEPTKEPLALIRHALNSVRKRTTWTTLRASISVHIEFLKLLSVTTWEEYPYKIRGLDSNDVLQAGNRSRFAESADSLATDVLNTILRQMKETVDEEMALTLFWVVIRYADLDSAPECASLALKLWKLNKTTRKPRIVKIRKALAESLSYDENKYSGENYKILCKRIRELEQQL